MLDAWCLMLFSAVLLFIFCLLGFTLGTFWRPVFFLSSNQPFASVLGRLRRHFNGHGLHWGVGAATSPLKSRKKTLGGSSHELYVVKWWGNHPPIYKPPKFRPFGREHHPMKLGDLRSPGFIHRLLTGVILQAWLVSGKVFFSSGIAHLGEPPQMFVAGVCQCKNSSTWQSIWFLNLEIWWNMIQLIGYHW